VTSSVQQDAPGEAIQAGAAGGTSSFGIGFAVNTRRQGFAIQRASWRARPARALSVASPVLAYI
jgi:hypothetical protein